jgi:hypothetical protein
VLVALDSKHHRLPIAGTLALRRTKDIALDLIS